VDYRLSDEFGDLGWVEGSSKIYGEGGGKGRGDEK
jgi:hypothetical protein